MSVKPREDIFKFVKKAGMICRTYWDEKGDQKQEWMSQEKYEELIKEREERRKTSNEN